MTDDYFLFLPNDLTNSFSDSFKEELKKQLHQRFYTMFGDHIVDKTFRFLLLVGAYKFVMPCPEGYAYSTELEMPIVDNGYVFLTTRLSIMHSPSHYTSICWTSPHFDDLLSIQTSDIIGKEVSFSGVPIFQKKRFYNR
ncbi:MAG: hypothetical protein M0D57_04275 [Sphingobacteriales bacterium JAD_PAG50586_3]|nr:MAG: hypothetical protein M0D57_04275 [Sphingobacteriales bacterium JAD_PAG50586_3]